jgi:hypothetical protein
MGIVSAAVQYAFAILEKIESEGGTIDSQTVMDAAPTRHPPIPRASLSISDRQVYALLEFLRGKN